MKYTNTFSFNEALVFLIILVFLFYFLFGFFPKIRRAPEYSELSIFDARALISFRKGFFAKGGGFYRVSLYNDFLIFVLLGYEKIDYGDIQGICFSDKHPNTLNFAVSGVRITLLGSAKSIKKIKDIIVAKAISK